MKSIPALAAVAVLCAACASGTQRSESSGAPAPSAPATSAPATSSSAANTRTVKSKDGSYTGEVVGTPARNAKFARLQIGMSMSETQNVLGRAPDRVHSYESGKRWIPYYFGNDARRMQVLYRGEGCLVFTGGNVWGGGAGDLIRIEHDAAGACYQP